MCRRTYHKKIKSINLTISSTEISAVETYRDAKGQFHQKIIRSKVDREIFKRAAGWINALRPKLTHSLQPKNIRLQFCGLLRIVKDIIKQGIIKEIKKF